MCIMYVIQAICYHGYIVCYHGYIVCFRVIVLQSQPTDDLAANSNLYVLAGHENMF
jgi:hypothetical protein